MAKATSPEDYDALVYTLMHESMDRLIEIAALCTAHDDILNEEIESGSVEHLLRAQMGIENGEEEINLTQQLLATLSNLLIQRRARNVVIEDCLDRAVGSVTDSDASPGSTNVEDDA